MERFPFIFDRVSSKPEEKTYNKRARKYPFEGNQITLLCNFLHILHRSQKKPDRIPPIIMEYQSGFDLWA
jgi:hypothetical protein